MKEHEMGETCGTWVEKRMTVSVFGSVNESDHLKVLGIDGRAWTRLIWFRIRTSDGLL
jgi:hypothetical protein